jgi:hypothetical protein
MASMGVLDDAALEQPERELLDRFVVALEQAYGDDLDAVWLYGSRARGERPHDESDAGHATTAICTAYYAMLYGARAALSERDRHARSHAGPWALFREELVLARQFDETSHKLRSVHRLGVRPATMPPSRSGSRRRISSSGPSSAVTSVGRSPCLADTSDLRFSVPADSELRHRRWPVRPARYAVGIGGRERCSVLRARADSPFSQFRRLYRRFASQSGLAIQKPGCHGNEGLAGSSPACRVGREALTSSGEWPCSLALRIDVPRTAPGVTAARPPGRGSPQGAQGAPRGPRPRAGRARSRCRSPTAADAGAQLGDRAPVDANRHPLPALDSPEALRRCGCAVRGKTHQPCNICLV